MKIVISGTVGVGKSTISQKIYEHLQSKTEDVFLMEEIMENDPYLKKYYENRPAWSYLIQINFVVNRFNKAFKASKVKGYKIFDRHFLDDYIIASMPFIKDDMPAPLWNSYHFLNEALNERLKDSASIEYFFLLKADFEKIIERVHGRGRESEKEVDLDYWRNMYDQYYVNPSIQEYMRSSVKNFIIIDANSNDVDEIVKDILSHIKMK